MDRATSERFWSFVNKVGPCWLWTGAKVNGYGKFRVDDKKVRAHRFAYELIYGPLKPRQVVRHKCDTPACVNPLHLIAGTQKANMQDAVRKGRIAKTVDNGRTKLTPDEVRLIRQRPNDSYRSLGRAFGVDAKTVSDIQNGKTWTSLA